jgi:TonB family protein
MKPKLLLLLFCVLPFYLLSQDTKKINLVSGDKYNKTEEVFYVLKQDEGVKQGKYEKYHNKKLHVRGYYHQNQKDSIWTVFNRAEVVTIKHYSKGAKTGVWEFFDYKGQPERKYDFLKNEIVFQKEVDTAQKKALPDDVRADLFTEILDGKNNWIKEKPDAEQFPLFSTGEYMWHLTTTLNYPQDAMDNEKSGTAIVRITIDENGRPMEYEITNEIFKSLGEEAIRVLKLLDAEYVPAMKNGKRVKIRIRQPITFKLATS